MIFGKINFLDFINKKTKNISNKNPNNGNLFEKEITNKNRRRKIE